MFAEPLIIRELQIHSMTVLYEDLTLFSISSKTIIESFLLFFSLKNRMKSFKSFAHEDSYNGEIDLSV